MKRQYLARILRAALVGIVLVSANPPLQAASTTSACAPKAAAKSDVVRVMEEVFVALGTDDQSRLEQLTTPDFYAYDGGQRFIGTALFDLIKQGHAAGKHWVWRITEPEVHVECHLAWITYVNQGALEDATGRQALTWLESAILEYSNGRWRIRFLHSTRAPKPT
jgi:hypothetical protein